MSFFTASDITAGYAERKVIDGVSFSFPKGSIVGLLGANGSGKTTLLKAIANVLPHTGSCYLNGLRFESLNHRRIARLCSYIPQKSGISVDISLLDAVLMGFNPQLKLLEHPSPQMRERATAALRSVGLADRADDSFLSLSEGQKQLCILARAIVSDATLYLFDEPESALDFSFRYQMTDTLRYLVGNDRGAIVTLHDASIALNCCDMLLVLHEGKIAATVYPRTDSTEAIERQLCAVYGNLSLHRIFDRKGNERLVLLKEDEV